jgi:hypothetical protein
MIFNAYISFNQAFFLDKMNPFSIIAYYESIINLYRKGFVYFLHMISPQMYRKILRE